MKAGRTIVIQSPKQIFFSQKTMSLSSGAIGEGNFGCCEMDHQVTLADGTVCEITCDKLKLGDVLTRRIKLLLASHEQDGDILEYRHLLTIQRRLVRGLPNGTQSFKPPVSLRAFLELYRFEIVTDNAYFPDSNGSVIGMTPLYYAAMVGNVPVLKALLAMPEVLAKINLRLKKGCKSSRYGELATKGNSVLLAAARYSDSPATLQLLVQHGADPSAFSVWSIFPRVYALHAMAMEHSNECLAWWLDQQFEGPAGDIEIDNGGGSNPLMYSLQFGGGSGAETVKLLVDRGATLETCAMGIPYLQSAIFGWDIEAFEMILSLGGQQSIDTLHFAQKPINGFSRRVMWILRLLYYAGDRRWWVFAGAVAVGHTTLHAAAFFSLAATKSVLRHHPDLHAKLRTGHTPLQLAQEMENESIVHLLLDAQQREKEC
jgi:ankyrin repeat protein